MTNRKQSLNDDQVLERSRQGKLPAAGVPRLTNFEYSGASGVDIPDDVNEPVGADTVLEAPRNLTVISQTLRFAPDGTQFVTIVVEFDEVENATGYESRAAKI